MTDDLEESEAASARLYVEAALAAGGRVSLDADRAHYLRNVLRLEPGASVSLFNGRHGEWSGSIAELTKRGAEVALLKQTRSQVQGPDVWLVFAPVKRARIDFIAEKATELGVSLLQPVFTRYTSMTRVNVARLRANAIEAAEQTERLSVPQLREPQTLDALLKSWPAERHLLLCDEAGGGQPIATALGSLGETARHSPWAILTGPEGGFDRAELDALRKLPFVVSVGLGPRILRADTAALAALACWQALIGDWQLPTPHLSGDYRHR